MATATKKPIDNFEVVLTLSEAEASQLRAYLGATTGATREVQHMYNALSDLGLGKPNNIRVTGGRVETIF